MQIFGRKTKMNAPQIMVLSFAGLILLGGLMLMLPISSAAGVWTPFVDAIFTSATSVCVTGLIVQDTATYWSSFGHAVILLMIQVGGLGVITVGASLAMLAGRKIGIFQRSTMQESVGAPKMGGVVRLTGFLLRATFLIEAIGAVVMAPTFIGDFGWGRGIWLSVFTSISAFCNAGLDLFGIRSPYSSLTAYVGNPVINLVVIGLIVVGGIGFLTWDDIRSHGIHIKRYRMQSKVILVTTGLLILIPAIGFFVFEFGHLPMNERIWASVFHAITPRTAGFNTVDMNSMSEPGKMATILLMLVGGSPGSTAGGMKTTTFAVIIACAYAVFRKRDSVQFFGRRIAQDVVATAITIFFMYVCLCVSTATVISLIEGLPMLTCLFETASAVATVGLTLGITPTLTEASKWILIILMYLGRVGGLTLIYAAMSGAKKQIGKLPLEQLTVG